ncbi:hypothetical protein KUTeg_001918 [Tegillarca granosa]|uniref:Uncharacterized protein n=1 Tax=Tegillarca granosa TaxID=220873 RepID=A0ABQ9FSU6_TEGGR|nr:hypothetical protein KUTeg_001918 [Tegillarca granosa]
MDAPAHGGRGKQRVHQVKLDRLTGPGVVVDIKKKIVGNVDYRLTVSDLKEWESRYGKISEKAIVLLNSGWDKYQNDYFKAFGTTNLTDTTSYHFPGWHEDAVLWLVKNRNVNMIGVDTPSIDYGQSQKFLAHQAGASNDLSMLESVANLDKIPPSGTIIYAAVTNILDGSGGPTRVFAVIDGNGVPCVHQTWFLWLSLFCALICFV